MAKKVFSLFDQINDRLLKILDEIDAIVYVIDIETYEILYINKQGNTLWGDILGKKCYESLRKAQTGPCPNCDNQRIMDSEHEGSFKTLYQDPIKNKWLDSRGHVIRWLGGRKAKLCIALDVTDQKRMETELEDSVLKYKMSEEALLESEQMFKSIVNNAASIIYTMNLEGYYSFVSPSWTEFLGHDSTEVEGRHFREYVHPEDISILEDLLEKAATNQSTQKRVLYRILDKNSNWHWHRLSGSIIEDKDRNILFHIGVVNDITEQVEHQQRLLKANQESEAALEEIISIEEELRIQNFHLENKGKELRDSKQLLEDILGFLPDATFVIDKEGKIVFWNNAIENMTGIKAEDVIGKGDYEYSHILIGKRQPLLIDLALNYNDETAKNYKNLKTQDKKVLILEDYSLERFADKYFSVNAAPLYNASGELIGALQSIRDVTSRREAEKKLRYIAEHDSITGLFNRSFFEKEMGNNANYQEKMIGLIVSDVDGLKLVNDTLGHQEGDKLLITSAEILKKACPQNSIISRIGGDEFCVILRDTREDEIFSVLRKMNKAAEEYNNATPTIPLSISHGISFCDNQRIDMLNLFKEAEEKMYYEKLLHSQSARSKVVDEMMKALEVRDYLTEGHSDRVGQIAEKIAVNMALPEHKINSLRLFARFHDIGKVGISDSIIFKPGKLSKREFDEMKKHCEIGFRIAQSTPDLAHISDWILKHHEWWNGNGYPFGLVGEEIPLECRILAMADSFDSMSSDRPYRKALSYEESIKELKRFAGIQFDPRIVQVFLDILGEKECIPGEKECIPEE